MWIAGFITGALWSGINFSLTIALFKIALMRQSPRRLSAILMVKFPLLYLAGFFILTSQWFPPMSLLAGLGASLLIFGSSQIWPKRT